MSCPVIAWHKYGTNFQVYMRPRLLVQWRCQYQYEHSRQVEELQKVEMGLGITFLEQYAKSLFDIPCFNPQDLWLKKINVYHYQKVHSFSDRPRVETCNKWFLK